MSIDTYAKLKVAVSDALARADLLDQVTQGATTIDGAIARFIDVAEKRLSRRLNVGFVETADDTLETVSGTETVAAPSNMTAPRMFYIDGDPIQMLDYAAPDALFSEYPNATTGKPEKYSIIGGNFYLRPIPDAAYSLRLVHYFKPAAMTADSDSNEWLVNCSDALTYAACLEAALHMEDTAMSQMWKGMLDEAIADIEKDDGFSRWNAAPIRPRLDISVLP